MTDWIRDEDIETDKIYVIPNDLDILRDIAAGRTIVYYNTTEETDKKESTYTVKR
jgi:hypothetical protein